MKTHGVHGFYPVVDDVRWVRRFRRWAYRTIQLRIKGQPEAERGAKSAKALAIAADYDGCQMIVNDYWREAIQEGAAWLHLGQEDWAGADRAAIREAGIAGDQYSQSRRTGERLGRQARLRRPGADLRDNLEKDALVPAGLTASANGKPGLAVRCRHRRDHPGTGAGGAGGGSGFHRGRFRRAARAGPGQAGPCLAGSVPRNGGAHNPAKTVQSHFGMSNPLHQSPDATSALSVEEQPRYARHLVLPEIGLAGQRKLRQASVLVIGAGGLGAPALLYLAAAGVGRLGIIDPDQVELSNLQRQVLYDTAGCGAAKTENKPATACLRSTRISRSTFTPRLSLWPTPCDWSKRMTC